MTAAKEVEGHSSDLASLEQWPYGRGNAFRLAASKPGVSPASTLVERNRVEAAQKERLRCKRNGRLRVYGSITSVRADT